MKKTNNKGFSLVELIIVIAIMAILVGAIAPALIRYIDKSRKSNDVSACKTIKTAIETAMANEDVYEDLTTQNTTITIAANTKLTSGENDDENETTTSKSISITSGSAASSDETVKEIAKNIGEKTPKISYKKATNGITPQAFYAIITTEGAIYVGIGENGASPSVSVGSDGKYEATSMLLICPEVCKEYK